MRYSVNSATIQRRKKPYYYICMCMTAIVGLCVNYTTAFTLSNHRMITNEALHRTGIIYRGEKVTFNLEAVQEINEEQAALDRAPLVKQFPEPFWHFDNESFKAGNDNLLRLKESIIARLAKNSASDGDVRVARALLARALHQIQDFYAHSNWVELGNQQINPDLGIHVFRSAIASSTEAVCSGAGILNATGKSKLTSGYYGGWQECSYPPGKCRHGISSCPEGLNKDDTDRPGFDRAKQLAIQATITFVEQMLNDERLKQYSVFVNKLMKKQ